GRSECFCKPRAIDKFLPQGECSLVAGMRPSGVHPPPGPWEGADPQGHAIIELCRDGRLGRAKIGSPAPSPCRVGHPRPVGPVPAQGIDGYVVTVSGGQPDGKKAKDFWLLGFYSEAFAASV